jgi:SAM-dependent methyltransferase
MDRRTHWERVYTEKQPDQVSWFQAEAALSLDLIARHAAPEAAIADIGGGASRLVDGLLARGFRDLRVLDLSATALDAARSRLGAAAAGVRWVVADVLTAEFAPASIDVWHDRAVFHFLTDPADRARYVAQVRRAVRPGGLVLVATFAEDGPLKCSGLEVARYSPDALHAEFGEGFAVVEREREAHHTPSGGVQWFTYCLCRYTPPAGAKQAA